MLDKPALVACTHARKVPALVRTSSTTPVSLGPTTMERFIWSVKV